MVKARFDMYQIGNLCGYILEDRWTLMCVGGMVAVVKTLFDMYQIRNLCG